jgi:hypothetical protein
MAEVATYDDHSVGYCHHDFRMMLSVMSIVMS